MPPNDACTRPPARFDSRAFQRFAQPQVTGERAGGCVRIWHGVCETVLFARPLSNATPGSLHRGGLGESELPRALRVLLFDVHDVDLTKRRLVDSDSRLPESGMKRAFSRSLLHSSTVQLNASESSDPARPYFRLVAAKDLAEGEIVFTEEAFTAMALNPDTCDGCLGPVQKRRRCRQCGTVLVCRESCLSHHSPMECIAFSVIRDEQIKRGNPKRQLWLRFCVRALLCTARQGAVETWRDLLGLASPTVSARHDEASLSDASTVIASLTEAGARDLLGGSLPTRAEVCDLMVRFGSNAIALNNAVDSETEEQAWGLFVGTTATNHSCQPNATWHFSGRKVEIRSTMAIASGDEVTVSYVPSTIPPQERAKVILREFSFQCQCTFCTSSLSGGEPSEPVASGTATRRASS